MVRVFLGAVVRGKEAPVRRGVHSDASEALPWEFTLAWSGSLSRRQARAMGRKGASD